MTWHPGDMAAKATSNGKPPAARGRVRDDTIARLEASMGALGTAAMLSMDRRLPWFRSMSAENRSWLGLVAQAGVAAFVDWVKHPERTRPAVAGEVFGTAPRELARAVTLQQAVEMVRVIVDVVESQVDELAAPGGEAELREAVLRYTREIAFGTAQVYARTAEARGAWDARLEALVVESLVRGEVDEGLQSWASALNWSFSPVTVIVGTADGSTAAGSGAEALIDEFRILARRARLDVLAGVHGNRLVLVVGGSTDPMDAARHFVGRFGPGPVVVGPGCRGPAVCRHLRVGGPGRAPGCRWLAGCPASGPGRRPPARARPGRRRVRSGRSHRGGVRAAAARRQCPARYGDDLSGAGELAGSHGQAAVRPPEYGAIPAPPGDRADRRNPR